MNKLIYQPSIAIKDEARIFAAYNDDNAHILNYLINRLKKNNNFQQQTDCIAPFAKKINDTNKQFAEKWVKNPRADLYELGMILDNINETNVKLADELLLNPHIGNSYVSDILGCLKTEENSRFIQRLHSTTKINGSELKNISELICRIDVTINNEHYECDDRDFVSVILNKAIRLKENYAEIMDECGYDINSKILFLRGLRVIREKPNLTLPSKEGLNIFFKTILANNNSEAENMFKIADFGKYKKAGIPLKYSRNQFYEKINEDILKGVKAEDRYKILHYFGIIDGIYTYDGLLQDKDTKKIKESLKTTKGKEAVDKIKKEIIKFSYENEVNTKDKNLNAVLYALIKGIPSYVSIIGKKQHNTHDYSVDVHSLKVLQSAMNNPLYELLSDESKMVLKLSAILHDIGKKEGVIDKGHELLSAKYSKEILNSLPLKPDVKTRVLNIIKNHHWFEGYNKGCDNSWQIAVICRHPEDFEIYRMLAKADIENVNPDFHLGIAGVLNQKEFDSFFDAKMTDIKASVDKIYQRADFVFNTKILNNGEKCPRIKVKMRNGEVIKPKVLDLHKFTENTSMESFGFARGITKKDLRFFVHMLSPETEVLETTYDLLQENDANHCWSTSFIKPDKNLTYYNYRYGLIFDVNQSDIAEASEKNIGSGTKKDFDDFQRCISEKGVLIRDVFDKALKKNGIKIGNDEYYDLVKYIFRKKYITAIKDFYIKKKLIKAEYIVKSIKKSEDRLFEDCGHNEVVVINPKLQGLLIKSNSIQNCPISVLKFAHKHDLPIILMKEER